MVEPLLSLSFAAGRGGIVLGVILVLLLLLPYLYYEMKWGKRFRWSRRTGVKPVGYGDIEDPPVNEPGTTRARVTKPRV
jgi:hypothetical protein